MELVLTFNNKDTRIPGFTPGNKITKAANLTSPACTVGRHLFREIVGWAGVIVMIINFDENSFVKAGLGAIRGMKRCFSDILQYTFEDCIKYTQDHFDNYQQRYGFTDFKNHFGRQPQLIDLQICFCETEK
jgi:hypothetical protein